MTVRILRHLITFVILCAVLFNVSRADDRSTTSDQKVPLVVLVTWDDAYKTPATNVYVEAYIEGEGFGVKYGPERSFVVKMVKPGQYEAALLPGIYDVFVSEASSTPRCKRVLLKGNTPSWNLMLEHDDLYLSR